MFILIRMTKIETPEKETLVQEKQKGVMAVKVLKHFMTFAKKFET